MEKGFYEGRPKTEQVLTLFDKETLEMLDELVLLKNQSRAWVLRMLVRNAYRRLEESESPVRMVDLAYI